MAGLAAADAGGWGGDALAASTSAPFSSPAPAPAPSRSGDAEAGSLSVTLEVLADAPRPGKLPPWARADRRLEDLAGNQGAEAQAGAAPGAMDCHGRFRVENRLGRDLAFLVLDLGVVRRDGAPGHVFSLAVMPVPAGRPVRVTLPVGRLACDEVAELVVAGVARCRARRGADPACGAHLTVASEAVVPLGR